MASPVTTQITGAPTGQNQTQLQIVGAYSATGATIIANGATSNAGNWGTLQVRGLVASTANNTYTYTVRIYLASQINTNTAGTAVSTYSSSIADNVRFVTTNSAWIEWEAPTNVGTDATAVALTQYTIAATAGSSCTVTAALTDLNDSAQANLYAGAGSSGVYHFNTAIATFTAAGTGTCAVTVIYTNTNNATAANQAGTASSSISVSLVTGATTTPATPTPLTVPFDQVFSSSLVVGYAIPNTWGGTATSATAVNLATGSPTFAFTVTGGAAATSTTAQRGTQSLANDGTTNQDYGFVPTMFNNLFNIYTGAYQRIVGTSVTTAGTTVNTPLAANTPYAVTVTATFTTGAGAPV